MELVLVCAFALHWAFLALPSGLGLCTCLPWLSRLLRPSSASSSASLHEHASLETLRTSISTSGMRLLGWRFLFATRSAFFVTAAEGRQGRLRGNDGGNNTRRRPSDARWPTGRDRWKGTEEAGAGTRLRVQQGSRADRAAVDLNRKRPGPCSQQDDWDRYSVVGRAYASLRKHQLDYTPPRPTGSHGECRKIDGRH
jgi:hypothetical protein